MIYDVMVYATFLNFTSCSVTVSCQEINKMTISNISIITKERLHPACIYVYNHVWGLVRLQKYAHVESGTVSVRFWFSINSIIRPTNDSIRLKRQCFAFVNKQFSYLLNRPQ